MTTQKSFKRLVRTRMEKTGESYTAARAMLLTADEPEAPDRPRLATSDEEIRRRTGRGWEEWFDALDEWGAAERPHKEIARWVADQLGVTPLAWNAQSIAGSYEFARGMRVSGERADGTFTATASRTVAVPVERLYDAFVEEFADRLRERTATRAKSARFDWEDGTTRVHVAFEARDGGRSRIALEHVRLPDADESERMKAYWREALGELKEMLEG
ncbi:MAG: hypothetical protein ACJ75R_07635 [Solirubrobacterales bacterium]